MSELGYSVKHIPPHTPFVFTKRTGVGVFYGTDNIANTDYDSSTAVGFMKLPNAEAYYGFALDEEETFIEDGVLDLRSAIVPRELRGKGVGKELIRLVLHAAHENGFVLARCEVLNPRIVTIIENLQKIGLVRASHMVVVPPHFVDGPQQSTERLISLRPIESSQAKRFLLQQELDEDGMNSTAGNNRLLAVLAMQPIQLYEY